MRKWIVLALALLCAAPAAAQTHYSVGLLTTNGLATEQTHHARLMSLPGALYVGISIDGKAWKGVGVTTGVNMVISPLQIEPCESVPCANVTPYNWRPRAIDLVEIPFWLFEINTGLRQRVYKGLDIGGGIATPIAICPYNYCGAAPMLIFGGWAETRLKFRLLGITGGLVGGWSALPPQNARWTTISEWTGYKQNGQPFPNGKNDPHVVQTYRLGVTVQR